MTAVLPSEGDAGSLADRARGALLGLAIGDAVGFPALVHRTVRLGDPRTQMWQFSAELDAQQVLRFLMPFTNGRPEPLAISGTDDTEFAAVAAMILLTAGADLSPEALFAGWRGRIVDARTEIWCGIAERASIENAVKGLLPPVTGNDNPAHYDDGAVARAVPVGIRFAGDSSEAARVATDLASITHAADGVWAAAAMAATIAVAVSGGGLRAAVNAGRDQIPRDSWLARQVDNALGLAEKSASAFDLTADLADEVANASYSFGTVAPETLASAYALTLVTNGNPAVAIPLAATVAKQSDSMPAMVGAICGAIHGCEPLPQRWLSKVSVTRGLCIPSLAGIDLADLADRLIAAREAARHLQSSVGS